MIEIKINTQQAQELEQYLYQHMELCETDLMGEEVPEDWSPFGIYDGCQVCQAREYLMATFQFLRNKEILDFYVDNELDNNVEDKLF